MGKARNRRYRKENNPTGLPNVKSIELEDDERGSSPVNASSKHEHIIQTVKEQMGSLALDSKLCGLNTLSSMTEEDGFVESMLKNNLVKIVGPLLIDPAAVVREAAAVALRNITGMGISEICDVLVDEDVLTYVFALFEKFYSSHWLASSSNGDASPMELDDDKKSKKKSKRVKKLSGSELKEDLLVNTFTQGVHILWNLCKSSDLAVKIFNQQNILSCISSCLDPKECGIDAAVAVAHCLQTVTENNEVAAHELRQTSEGVLTKILSPAFEEEMASSQKSSQILLLRVLAAGIVMNISKSSPGISPVLNLRLAAAIKDAVATDHRKALSAVDEKLTQENGTDQNPSSVEESVEEGVSSESMDADDSCAVAVEDVTSLVNAQIIAIELLTNLYYKEECEDLPENEEVCNGSAYNCSVPEVEEVFWEKESMDNIFRKVEKDESVWSKLEANPETKSLMSRVSILRCRSLLCLQNVLPAVSDDDLSGFPGALSVLEKLASLVCQETGDETLLEAATGAMRAMSERVFKMDPKAFAAVISMSQLQLLLDVEAKCKDSITRVNIIRTVGTMGEALAHSSTDDSCNLLGHVGSFLLLVCTKAEEELWVVAEALDALMDVFAEDCTDKAAVQIGLVQSLKTLLPRLRSKLRQQRKSLGHHAAVVATANTNLESFIDYKVKHISH
ncbi:HEAT repeat-containing protein 3 isoform X2 [Ischnura elegans]|uniref:HEAT repeat-containing protein 3 isoform X2 n=1 Tax=Ischnura elegans TaxID=197161 RepID=UPI001ED86B46|nr:HEAT repeat-containing protein 3 isoform X2 [Ischnura elegans]